MKRVICTATIRNEATMKDVIDNLKKSGVDYTTPTQFKIKVDYNGFDPGTFNMITDLFESLESHTIHYFY